MGFPGSGKTYFSSRYAKQEGLFHLNSDRMRLEMFDHPTYQPEEHRQVFRVMDYVAEELLSQKMSVMYDANLNKVIHRQKARDLANTCGAEVILLWFKTPVEVALERIARRGDGQDKYYRKVSPEVLYRMKDQLEEPQDEPHIVIDGTADYDTQYKQLQRGIA